MLKKIHKSFSRLEKILLAVSILTFFISGSFIIRGFWVQNTHTVPSDGGEFVEGSIGQIDQNFMLNPLFTFGAKSNSAEADITQLVFAGLMRYNSETETQEDFLADHTLSRDKKTYTFTLKKDLRWHDGYPITADDVIFTFRDIIQHPDFENEFLRSAFEGVEIKKIDQKTVTFRLAEPYKFFLTNFTVGLIPRHALLKTPVKNLSIDSFSQSPIGAGPYKFETISQKDPDFDEIRLSKFKDFILQKPKIDFITFRLYHSTEELEKNIDELDGVRPNLKTEDMVDTKHQKFEKLSFNLPQYIAVFINMENDIFKGKEGKKMRWALQLATNKEKILNQIPGKRIDTPLLEIDEKNWLSEYDLQKASGALKDSGWILKSKIPQEKPTEENTESDTEKTTEKAINTNNLHAVPSEKARYLKEPSELLRTDTTNNSFFITGRFPEGTTSIKVNNYTLQKFDQNGTEWTYKASTEIGTLKKGQNTYKIQFIKEDQIIDEETITINLTEQTEEPAAEPKEPETQTPETEEPTELTDDPEVQPEEPAVEPEVTKEEYRVNNKNEELTLKILTATSPSYLKDTAEIIKEQWKKAGIKVEIEALDNPELIEKIKQRNYTLLLYGQNLGYNTDAFPYWHLSQVKQGLNLSEYQNFEASILIEEIRKTHDEELRQENLKKLEKIISEDTPAVFLYSPEYILNINKNIKNVKIENLSLYPDRFSNVESWYIHSERVFKEGTGWTSFIPWFWKQIF
ncbi:MAG: ABC transporter substrate-binding protein [Candidatus Gracilibacteria bacterium]|jgi:ABC-type transport system substrate-binding protein|nr:ABC transporter substrate-binding protein [Candidatus Gracilibacteria bacterium]